MYLTNITLHVIQLHNGLYFTIHIICNAKELNSFPMRKNVSFSLKGEMRVSHCCFPLSYNWIQILWCEFTKMTFDRSMPAHLWKNRENNFSAASENTRVDVFPTKLCTILTCKFITIALMVLDLNPRTSCLTLMWKYFHWKECKVWDIAQSPSRAIRDVQILKMK